jgi:hypothetical protein
MGIQYKAQEFAGRSGLPVCRKTPKAAASKSSPDLALHFWQGASGQRYVHTVFDLLSCPRLPACTYVLVKRDAQGNCHPLRIGTVSAEAWSLNLAEIRHRAAQLGANEVHAHLIAAGSSARLRIAQDLQAGQFAEFAAEPATPPHWLC